MPRPAERTLGVKGQSERRNILGGLVRFGRSENSLDGGWCSVSSWSGTVKPAPFLYASVLIYTFCPSHPVEATNLKGLHPFAM